LAGAEGDSVGGWLLLLLPLSALVYVLFSNRIAAPWLRRVSANWDRSRAARFDFVKFLVALGVVFVMALFAAHALDGLGFDPRGGPFDTYVQRNALIVGFVMGFAIIPIIYTLAEDALSSVPSHLRLASLGAGATLWQTAMRVVVPTAMSGLFSAVMIGLGRAVGETMIVLMATGNTPVASWNVFNGFRTLSANIAVELPEAVRDSTHYRTLFLAAFCLFALTFVLNTFAEVVRQRFRKRAYQL
jgi:phosphate transport system permease protein